MTGTVELLIVGGSEAAYCAAAAAARAGASTALVSRKKGEAAPSPSCCHVPNFVWRRLDLQEYGLALEPVSARVTLLPNGQSVATYRSARETKAALAQAGKQDHVLWADFAADMNKLGGDVSLVHEGAGSASQKSAAQKKSKLSYLFGDLETLSAIGQISGSCASLLDDYLGDAGLKAHVAVHALSRAGIGAAEAGGASALPEFLSDEAWRMRPSKDGPPLIKTLETICRDNGVDCRQDEIVDIESEGGRSQTVTFASGDKIKARYIVFASPEAASASGYFGAASPLAARGRATAQLRIKLKKPMAAPAADERAVFQILDDLDDLQSASDAVADGALPEKPPVAFEFAENGDIIAETSYCPKAFREEDEWRGWTGQDRQAMTKRIMDRLSDRIDGLAVNVRKSDLKLFGADGPEKDRFVNGGDNIFILPNRHNAVAEAVKLIDRVLSGE